MEIGLKYHSLNIYHKVTMIKNKIPLYYFFSPCKFTFFLKTDLRDISFLMSICFTQRPSVKVNLAI